MADDGPAKDCLSLKLNYCQQQFFFCHLLPTFLIVEWTWTMDENEISYNDKSSTFSQYKVSQSLRQNSLQIECVRTHLSSLRSLIFHEARIQLMALVRIQI